MPSNHERKIGARSMAMILTVSAIGLFAFSGVHAQTQNSSSAPAAATTTNNAGTNASFNGTFTRNLTIGDIGADVMALQQFLNASGFQLASSGPGSPGSETNYFGSLTRAALAQWQAANNISPAVGYFGPLTRAAIQSVMNGGTTTNGTTTGGMNGTNPSNTVPSNTGNTNTNGAAPTPAY